MTLNTQSGMRKSFGLLVADDDVTARNAIGDAMRKAGFSVWLAADGREALDVCRTSGDAIHVALIDVQMPRLDGPTTISLLRWQAPHVRCCLMSEQPLAFSEDALNRLGADAFVQKPIVPSELTPILMAFANSSASSGMYADRYSEIRRSNGHLLSSTPNAARQPRSQRVAVAARHRELMK